MYAGIYIYIYTFTYLFIYVNVLCMYYIFVYIYIYVYTCVCLWEMDMDMDIGICVDMDTNNTCTYVSMCFFPYVSHAISWSCRFPLGLLRYAVKIGWKARGSFSLAAQQCSGRGIRDIKKPRQANFSKYLGVARWNCLQKWCSLGYPEDHSVLTQLASFHCVSRVSLQESYQTTKIHKASHPELAKEKCCKKSLDMDGKNM